jgi:hypothetical protein
MSFEGYAVADVAKGPMREEKSLNSPQQEMVIFFSTCGTHDGKKRACNFGRPAAFPWWPRHQGMIHVRVEENAASELLTFLVQT